jgi:uncharacterized protein YcbK (DUF882 family)/LysM repeat protein
MKRKGGAMKSVLRGALSKSIAMVLFSFSVSTVALEAWASGPLESSADKSSVDKSSAGKSPSSESLEVVSEYEVKSGDVLGSIALSHGIRIEDLMKANGITNPDRVLLGQKLKIPGDPQNGVLTKRGVVLHVPRNFTLSRIAAAYKIPVKKIINANKLKNPDALRENQELLIPGAKSVVKLILPPPCFKDPVSLYRVRTDETQAVPLCFCDGRPNPAALDILSAMSGPVGENTPFPLHPRLLKLLQLTAEQFPGRRIEIISGQRVAKRPDHESYHSKGQALDFRVEGVPNKKLVDFARKFDKIGVGYYPNSVFIHIDTREQNAYWIDYSGPGEKPIYGRAGMTAQEIEMIRAKRAQPQTDQKLDQTT